MPFIPHIVCKYRKISSFNIVNDSQVSEMHDEMTAKQSKIPEDLGEDEPPEKMIA